MGPCEPGHSLVSERSLFCDCTYTLDYVGRVVKVRTCPSCWGLTGESPYAIVDKVGSVSALEEEEDHRG